MDGLHGLVRVIKFTEQENCIMRTVNLRNDMVDVQGYQQHAKQLIKKRNFFKHAEVSVIISCPSC